MGKRASWQTRFGFYLIAIGSAFGLGNLWRFPYVVGENGGGAFILLYVLLSFAIGIPALIAELMIGRRFGKGVVQSFHTLLSRQHQFRWIGYFSVFISLVVLSYYSVISGWVLHFLTQFAVGVFHSNIVSENQPLQLLMTNGWMQVLLASCHILIAVVVITKGVHEGLEKWISWIMPVFLFLAFLLLVKSFNLPSTPDVLRFLFYPDFSKLTAQSLIHALGHVFFTLSVGFGSLITFGSYMSDKDHLPTVGFRVAFVDTVVSLLAAIMIFPIAFQASNVPLTDPTLLFQILPQFLASIRGGEIFGLAFFICLYLAALNATLGLLEGIVSNIVDLMKVKDRSRATWISGLIIFIFSLLPSFSSTAFSDFRFQNKSLIEALDVVLINWTLPFVVLIQVYLFVRYYQSEWKKEDFIQEGNLASQTMYSHWLFSIKWLLPLLIIFGFSIAILLTSK